MQTRTLGKTGWEISVIGFGAIKLPRLSSKKCEIILNQAIDRGINFVDTADCYGDSEEKIGTALRARRQEYYLSTKIDERDGPGVEKKLARCLRRLKTDWIDLVFFHDVRGSEYSRIFDSGGLESTRQKSSFFFHPFLDNTPPVPVQAGFDKVLMNHSQPSQFQMFNVQLNRW